MRGQAQGNLCDGSRTNLQGRSWTTTIFRSPTINTVRKISRTFDSSRLFGKYTDIWSKDRCVCRVVFVSTAMIAAVHLGQNYNDN